MADATIAVADEAEAETATSRSQMEKHKGFVEWYEETYEGDMTNMEPSQIIAEFARFRNEFRRSDFYLSQWGPEAREANRAARELAREKAAAEREAARKAKAAEKAAAKEAAEKNGEGETKPKSTRRRVAKKAASTIEVDETEGGEEVGEDEIFD